jgi:hypothetical protein
VEEWGGTQRLEPISRSFSRQRAYSELGMQRIAVSLRCLIQSASQVGVPLRACSR